MASSLTARLQPHAPTLALPALACILALGLACLGLQATDPVILGPANLLYYWLSAGLVALAWLAAAFGLGWPVVALLVRGAKVDRGADFQSARSGRAWLQMPLGVAAMLFLDHALGVLGLLSGPGGRITAITLCAVGTALLAAQAMRFFKSAPVLTSAPWTTLLAVPGLAIMLVAACNPPGVLWSSEAGGFDALSYHLPLAQEWACGSRIWPLEHNVYSYLPSYMESAYTHIAALNHGSLVAGEGLGVLTCQLLNVALAALAAALTGRAAYLLAKRAGASDHPARLGAGLAASIFLATPWTVVTGSLAYNEMPACALFAGAIIAALNTDLSPARRALITGLLMGAACACKPTFMFLACPTVGLLLIASVFSPLRLYAARLTLILLCGTIGGLVTFSPPLIRNYAAAHNPVFPAATTLFHTTSHWTPEQVERFQKAHGPTASFASQLALLVSPYSTATVDHQPRGFLHEQWGGLGILPFAGFGAMILLILRPATRQQALCLFTGALVACAWWAGFSHAQSRFLLPVLVPMAVALGALAARWWGDVHGHSFRRTGVIVLTLLPLLCGAKSLSLFLVQAGGRPNGLLIAGVPLRTGETIKTNLADFKRQELEEMENHLGAEFFINLNVTAPEKVYLLGDSTPLYYTAPIVYHTTWDRSPLGAAMAAHPDTPSAWTRALRDLGCRYVLINLDELERYMNTYGYDPAVTPQRLHDWIATLGEPLKQWQPSANSPGQIFFRLPPAPPAQGASL